MIRLSESDPDGDPLEVISGVVSIFRTFIVPDRLAKMLAVLLLQTQDLDAAIETLKSVNGLKEKAEQNNNLN